MAALAAGGCASAAQLLVRGTVAPAPTLMPTPAVIQAPTAISVPNAASSPVGSQSLPTVSPTEGGALSATWLYLTAFQSHNISVIDPSSGQVLHEIPVSGDQAGMAIAPDGKRLYVVDGQGLDGQLRVIDTTSWQSIHREPIAERAQLLGGNPISLSGDGRWVVVEHYNYARREAWTTIFDAQTLQFLPGNTLELPECRQGILHSPLVGRPGHPRLYWECSNSLMALDADSLSPLWTVSLERFLPAFLQLGSTLALSPDGASIYGVFPLGGEGCFASLATDLRVEVRETTSGQMLRQIKLKDQARVPMGTCGRGGGVYLAISPDGARLFIAWEDRLWALASESLKVIGELELPAAVDGLTQSIDGGELYLLPATAGDLHVRERGLWTIDANSLKLLRHTADWAPLNLPFMFAAPMRSQ